MRVPALRVNQWPDAWDSFEYLAKEHQSKPEDHYYMASIPAVILRRLTGDGGSNTMTVSGAFETERHGENPWA